MKRSILLLAGGLALGPAMLVAAPQAANTIAASSGSGTVRFVYENPKLEPAKYIITVHEDGSGQYRSERGAAAENSPIQTLPLDRPIQISSRNRDLIFRTARQSKLFAFDCGKGGEHTAFQGTKILAYQGPDGAGSCTYNWSQDKKIEKLTSIFEGISFTLQEGSRLAVEDTYSKLALDHELATLVQAAHDGSASELGNIAPILQKIAADERNLNRARRNARELLTTSAK